MEIMGTNFSITLGSWRLRLGFAIEDVDMPAQAKERPPSRADRSGGFTVLLAPRGVSVWKKKEAHRAMRLGDPRVPCGLRYDALRS